MAGDASPYATLGLEPGADWKAIEKAYHKLIKRHHPDRAGGDAARAAEITRAYRELKRERSEGRALVLLDELEPVDPNRTWPRYAFLAAGAALLLVAIRGASLIETLSASEASGARVAHSTITKDEPDPMDRPLALSAIDGAIADAMRTARMKDEVALASASGDCHRRLRIRPSMEQLDRCAAFDDAVVELQNRDPLRDQGPFSELAVTGRQMNAAAMLSNDYVAIDGRLDRIRLRVELVIAPALPTTPGNPGTED
jgi:hypothetical protein